MSATLTAARSTTTRIAIGGHKWLEAQVNVPSLSTGIVLFAHGSGSSRHSPRNQYVASHLNLGGVATVLVDLLTSDEERLDDRTRALRFDIAMLTDRMVDLISWVREYDLVGTLPLGLFGASTGAAAALDAAAMTGDAVRAIVSRGGRPDLASRLPAVKAPTLLIVGGNDRDVLDLNVNAAAKLTCIKDLEVISGATHLFDEPGTLEAVASAAAAWFQRYLK